MSQNTANLGDNTTQAPDVSGDGMAIAFSQDNLSFSYAEVTEQVSKISATTQEYETEMTALQATYTMGAMTLGMSMYETDNPEGTTGKYEETELSVSFAF
jgi:predicted porin